MGDSGLCYCVSCLSRAIFPLLVETGKPTNKRTKRLFTSTVKKEKEKKANFWSRQKQQRDKAIDTHLFYKQTMTDMESLWVTVCSVSLDSSISFTSESRYEHSESKDLP